MSDPITRPRLVLAPTAVEVPVPPWVMLNAVVNPEMEVISELTPEKAGTTTVQLVLVGLQPGDNVSPGVYGEIGGVANAKIPPPKIKINKAVKNSRLIFKN